MIDGPVGCDPAFCVVWFRFRLLRRYLAFRPGEVFRAYRLLERSAGGCPGHGPVHLLLQSASTIGFHWDSLELAWSRPGLPLLSNLSGPFRIFVLQFLVLGGMLFLRSFVLGRVFVVVLCLILMVLCSSLTLTMFGRDKTLLRSILVGGVWNGFLLGKVQGQDVPCRFCGGRDSDGHLFWNCTFPPLVEVRENPEFHDLIEMDKTSWPRCLLCHGWLPIFSGVNGGSPWALSPAEGASNLLEVALGVLSGSWFVVWINWVMMGLMRPLIVVVGEFRGGLLTQGGIFLVFAPDGDLLSLCCIASLLVFLGLWLIMMMVLVLLLILLSGLLVVLLREDGLRCGIGLSYLGRLIFGLVLGSLLLSPNFLP